jgi:glucose-1-phosphate adenylyltransferase
VTEFKEKPATTASMPGKPGKALASMGNYIFSADVLKQELRRARERGESDFGKHILPRMVESHRLLAYDFTTNVIPGVGEFEEHAYWRDVGTIDAYFEAHLDTLGAKPRFRMTNPEWPIYASADQYESAQIESGVIQRSVVGSGCIIHGAHLDHTMLRRAVVIEPDAHLSRCIVMDHTCIGRGAKLRNVIIDQGNDVPAGEIIGFDLTKDRQRFHVSDGGVVVVPRDYFKQNRV